MSTSIRPKILAWGGGSALRLIQVQLQHINLKVNYCFQDDEKPRAIDQLAPELRPDLKKASLECTHYIIAIGAHHGKRRSLLSQLFREAYYLKPLSLIHPTAYICPTAKIKDPILAFPGAVVHSFAEIDSDCILNTNSVVEHECRIGQGVHIMGSSVITGRVSIGNYTTIGTNATILPDLNLESEVFVGAGAVVTKDVAEGDIVAGIPAKSMQKG